MDIARGLLSPIDRRYGHLHAQTLSVPNFALGLNEPTTESRSLYGALESILDLIALRTRGNSGSSAHRVTTTRLTLHAMPEPSYSVESTCWLTRSLRLHLWSCMLWAGLPLGFSMNHEPLIATRLDISSSCSVSSAPL
ncbi:uncharacterized protein BO97DRAFT_73770 [Aspergillus homomorphus CBS 101889]|uniref:Uncharacterized protein n=1 Tax=Aspergillus homomorphus (strain CBS 101889) TaxID=1450537 RepID=A0A395IC46_ASPHC|nr:hypothetical protein BO97DRAFT_73770 [Aspergillus homomorphus CBS 101889]RAL16713.1 hypothetical protein BO97DRAFT_73770 [Aspergillus homomorphus CBS 101889]